MPNNDDFPIPENDPLGGDIVVKGIDDLVIENPDENDGDLGGRLGRRDRAIDAWAKGAGAGPSPLPAEWNTLPFGAPGPCLPKLFVDVRSSADINTLLLATCNHLSQCPSTELVVFHVGGSIGYLEWLYAFLRKLPALNAARPHARFATRVAWSWMPRPNQRPGDWKGAICGAQADNGNVIPHHLINRAAFKHRVWLLEELGLLSLHYGYIRLHTGQPTMRAGGRAFKQGPDFTFAANLNGGGMDQWKARIYIRPAANTLDAHVLGFHSQLLRHHPHPPVQFGNLGNQSAWIAQDTLRFLVFPYAYLDQASLLLHR